MVAGRPAARVGERLAAGDEVDGGQGHVDGRPRRLPGSRPDQGHRVVGEEPRSRPDRGGRDRLASQLLTGEDVGDDVLGGEADGRPVVPGRAEEVDERRIVHREQGRVVVRDGRDLAGAGGDERAADRNRPRRQLRRRRAYADPHLCLRLVQLAVVFVLGHAWFYKLRRSFADMM